MPSSITDSYLTIDEARDYLAALPGLTALAALEDEALGLQLSLASIDLDASMRFQGRKVDARQVREFPRVAYGRALNDQRVGVVVNGLGSIPTDAVVWDWDEAGTTPVVPEAIKIAALYQAAWLLKPELAGRLEAIRSGLASQGIGSASESYLKPGDLGNAVTGLSDRAARILEKYRLKTGKLL